MLFAASWGHIVADVNAGVMFSKAPRSIEGASAFTVHRSSCYSFGAGAVSEQKGRQTPGRAGRVLANKGPAIRGLAKFCYGHSSEWTMLTNFAAAVSTRQMEEKVNVSPSAFKHALKCACSTGS